MLLQAKAAATVTSADFVFIDDCSLPLEIAKRRRDAAYSAVLSPPDKEPRTAKQPRRREA